MSDDAKWLIGILIAPICGLVAWAFRVNYDLRKLRHDLNNCVQTGILLDGKLERVYLWKIENFGRNGMEHKDPGPKV